VSSKGVIPGSLKLASIAGEIHKYVEISNQRDLESDESFHDTVIRYLHEKKHLLSDEQIEYSLQYMRSLELWHGIDIVRTSSKYASIDNEGRDALALHYDKVLDRHVKALDSKKVKLNTVVKSVTKKKTIDKRAVLEIVTTSNEVYQGQFAIVTVPQSILQLSDPTEQGYIDFNPPLPARITESLERIHFGALGKVIFEFEKPFWPIDSERILVLADPPDGFLESIKQGKDSIKCPQYSTNPPKNWEFPILFLNLSTSFQNPALVALIQSPVTEYIESNPAKAWDFFKPVLQKISNMDAEGDIASPINQIVTEWTTDPFQRGSYSACFPGDDPLSAIIALEEGFGNIRFAGEHTILEGAGCVHGAWNSGKREAEYIIERLGN
jgi:polyamine oxidase